MIGNLMGVMMGTGRRHQAVAGQHAEQEALLGQLGQVGSQSGKQSEMRLESLKMQGAAAKEMQDSSQQMLANDMKREHRLRMSALA